ncbi:MAG: glycosyltransferase family 2 protein [Ignavibacteriales bacterium]|nr:glycosyltransferase family 2 protein [Ignavibacteriales bacterium]
MNEPNKISVIIITKNENQNITDCLNSVKWADEIIIIDAESSDNTIELAKKFTDKVFIRKWNGYSDQKMYALSLAKNEWVLSLDADERITDELKNEILFSDLSIADGYKISRANYFLGRLIRGCGWSHDYQLRLFRKSKTKVTERMVHEGFIIDGKISELKSSMLHYSYRNFHDAMNKINQYSTLEAQEKYQRKKVNGFTILLNPFIAFVQFFIFRKGFIDGAHGLLVSIMHGMTKMMMYIKMWELQKKHK